MVKFTLANATTRTEVIADGNTTLEAVLTEQGYPTTGVTVHVNGVPADITSTVSALGITDGAMVMSVPFQKAGNR